MATHQQDQLTVFNPTDEPFTVKWAGNAYMLGAKMQIIWPRFLAEHFAKHLADSILLRRERQAEEEYKKGGRPMSEFIAPALLNSRRERPLVVDSIILGVYTYYTPQANGGAAEIQRQIDQWNATAQQPQQPQERVANMGDAVDPLLGNLEDDDETDEQEPPASTTPPPATPAVPTTPAAAPPTATTATDVQTALGSVPATPVASTTSTTPPPATPAVPTTPAENGLQKRNRLIKEAKQLRIKVNPSMTTEMLEAEIKKQFA